ncbi:MAG TPA: TetR/AcrR family transcriptional regulator [Pseudolysinimonas sp.]|nr:TetR/AcrR family transcriptional regulator [Pseudolysinimonas sp.]
MDDSPDEPELPRAVALAWGVAASPQRGPKRELSIERIVEVAVRLADDGGLAAVSMAAIAGELGVTSMALYRYVTSKDDLLVLMQEDGIGLPPEQIREAATGGWRAGLEAWSIAMSAIYREHPWLLDVPIEGTPTTPNNLAWLDVALEVLAAVPLDGEQKTSAILALIAQARWESHIIRGYAQAMTAAGGDADQLDRQTERMLGRLVSAEALPHVHEALQTGVFSPDAAGDPFAFGRALVLDGLEALISGRVAPPVAPEVDPFAAVVERDPKVKEAVKARREVEKHLREARKRERDMRRNARERARR